MSELKYQLMLNKERSWVPCYLKSEADKVIADLESRNTQLRKDKANLLRNNENLKLEIKSQELGRLNDKLQYDITELHQKYKRCLAMVKYCHESAMWLEECGFTKSATFMLRWQKRWLELAEKFKPNNSTAQ